MKQIILLPIFLILSLLSRSQSQCDSLFFNPISTSIESISMINDSVMVAVGDYGFVIKSTNSGSTWRNIPLNYNRQRLSGVQFVNDSIGYAVGDGGLIKTTDQGENWFTIKKTDNPYANGYSAMFFVNKDTGFFVGVNGIFSKTADGGMTFKDTVVDYFNSFTTINFINDTTGLIAGHGAMLKTNDGGKNWQNIDISNIGYYPWLTKVKYITPMLAIAISDAGLIRSTDGGNTWAKFSNENADFLFGDFYFYNKDTGVIVTPEGVVFNTTDGGVNLNFNYNTPAGAKSFNAIAVSPSQKTMVAAGGKHNLPTGNYGRYMFLSTDQGANWVSQGQNGWYNYSDFVVINDSTVIMGGNGGVTLKTRDYGTSWKQLGTVPSILNNPVSGMYFIDSLNGFAVTDQFCATADGGKTWEIRNLPVANNGFVKKLYFFDTLHGLALASNTALYKTDDGAKTWVLVAQTQLGAFLTDFTMANNGRGFVVGYKGELQLSADSGRTWKLYDLHTTDYLNGVYFYDDLIGFVGTSDTTIYKTVDGGLHWVKTAKVPFYGSIKSSFAFSDNLNGYMVASPSSQYDASIFKTKDGGNTWVQISSGIATTGKILGSQTFYVPGNYGVILKTDHLYKPSIPSYISGPVNVCNQQTSSYGVIQDNNTNYNWSLSGGGTQKPIGSVDSISWATSGGTFNISVVANNVCGTGPARTEVVNVTYFKPVITVSDTVLSVTKGSYYQWYRNDTIISSGSNDSNSVLITKTPGIYKAEVLGPNGCSNFTDTVHFTWAQVLPLTLVNFTASLTGKDIVLDWHTVNEINVGTYVVEKSMNSFNFSPLGNIPAKNSSTNNYTYIDNSFENGKIYYRLKMVDKDGVFAYSNVAMVKIDGSVTAFLYPNPAKNEINIFNRTQKIRGIKIYNNLGVLVYDKGMSAGVFSMVVNTSNLANGSYYASIQTESTHYGQRFIVLH